ncbi:hypothetical protein F5884DRAFT_861745 [Xylogone sp. PMI_703]|nr:hypothetical protein F5884DRAFT_861745 [Xylogone sp. PMI_703]
MRHQRHRHQGHRHEVSLEDRGSNFANPTFTNSQDRENFTLRTTAGEKADEIPSRTKRFETLKNLNPNERNSQYSEETVSSVSAELKTKADSLRGTESNVENNHENNHDIRSKTPQSTSEHHMISHIHESTEYDSARETIANDRAINGLNTTLSRPLQTLTAQFLMRFMPTWKYFQPLPIPADKVRIEWECKCGYKSYDDYTELQPGAAGRLERNLTHPTESNTTRNSSFFSKAINIFGGILNLRREPALPVHELSSLDNQLASDQTQPRTPGVLQTNLMYLLLCYNKGRFATHLLQIDLVTLGAECDGSLFKIVRQSYDNMKGRLIPYISLRTVTVVKFVRFGISRSELVDVQKQDDIPPPDHAQYTYKPTPPELIPPIGERYMMHLFQYPSHAEGDIYCLERLPKKLKEKLKCDGSSEQGWGLYLVEGLDMRKIWLISFILFGFGSLLIGVLWAIYEHSIQDAFSIGSYMVAFATVTIGTVQALLVM